MYLKKFHIEIDFTCSIEGLMALEIGEARRGIYLKVINSNAAWSIVGEKKITSWKFIFNDFVIPVQSLKGQLLMSAENSHCMDDSL